MTTPAVKPSYSRIVVLRNPHSTRAQDEFGLVDELRGFVDAKQFHELAIEDRAGGWLTQASKHRWLGPQTVLAVLGGDGTLNQVVGDLLRADQLSERQRQVLLLPLWGGNANDLARTLNGMPSQETLRRIMAGGRIVNVRPIEFNLTPRRGKVQQRMALCYASFGASAVVAQVINGRAFRRGTMRSFPLWRFVRELGLVIRTLAKARRFAVREGADNRRRRIFERVFMNGPRLAKVERIALKLTDEYFYETTVTRMRLGILFSRALELSDRRFANKVAQTRVSFTVEDSVLAQFDGEDEVVRAGTVIEASVGEQPFRALSIRLHT